MIVLPSSISYRSKKTKALGIPTVDLSVVDKSELANVIVKACEEYGFFKVVNHGVPREILVNLESQGRSFFAKPASEKQRTGPPTPFGYGCKNIGFNGDMGELEYLLLQANPLSIFERSQHISNDPAKFSCGVNDYIGAVRNLACEILEMVAQGLGIEDKYRFSNLIRDVDSDSCFRINHYPPINNWNPSSTPLPKLTHQKYSDTNRTATITSRVGFGQHSDPQILTILRSNEVGGLQICSRDGFWIPVPPNPSDFCVLVGDALEAMSNGRFVSVIHRVLATSDKPRMSMMYFGAPSPRTWISPLPEMVSTDNPSHYKCFTWSDYKKAAYSLRLGDRRLDLFKFHTITDKSAASVHI